MASEIVFDGVDKGVAAINEIPDPIITHDGVRIIQELSNTVESFESPIDINLSTTLPLDLPELIWHHNDLAPKKMKCTNTGHTLILSAKWLQERPHLSGGPYIGKYVFSQLHFHWGKNNMEGSEHTVDGTRQPLEMHVVYFKSCYLTQEASLKKRDGMSVLAFFFKLQEHANPIVQIIINALMQVQKPHTSIKLDPPLPLNFILRPFKNDYFAYWGSVNTSSCIHLILWLISREPIGISVDQCQMFRSMLDTNEQPLLRNFRDVQPRNNANPIFHVNPSASLFATLLHVPVIENRTPKTRTALYQDQDRRQSIVNYVTVASQGPFKAGARSEKTEKTDKTEKTEKTEKKDAHKQGDEVEKNTETTAATKDDQKERTIEIRIRKKIMLGEEAIDDMNMFLDKE